MGVCMSKAKSFAETIDKKHIEMSVKARKVSISERAVTLANEYTRRISAGETVVLKPEEFLPKTDLAGIETTLGPDSTAIQKLKSALYVASNQIYRNTLKDEVWNELKAGMEAKKLPAPIIQHSRIAADQAIEIALDKQLDAMSKAVDDSKPMVSDEEVKEVAEWNASRAKESAAKEGGAQAKSNENFDKTKGETVGGSGVAEKEKEFGAEEPRAGLSGGVGHERNTEIAAV